MKIQIMKQLSILSAALAAGLFVAASAHAQVISVEFDSNALQAAAGSLSGGEVPETIWNSDTNSSAYVGAATSSASDLTDSTDTVTTVSENTVNEGTYSQYHTLPFSNPGDVDLFTYGYLGGYEAPETFTLNLTGLSPTDTFSLLLYVVGTADSTEELSATQGSNTYYFDSATDASGNNPASTYIPATSTIVGTPTPVADYIEFDGLTGTTLTATVNTLTNGQDFNVAGFQLVETAVPEPATFWSLGLGLLALVGFQRKRFFARS